jgi:hypothetical protein
MSAAVDAELSEVQAKIRAQNEYAGQQGEQWMKRHEAKFARLDKGTHVAINCRTGEYVLGSTVLHALDEFERQFGKNETGYMIEIGGGAFVGGGIV